MGQSQKEVGHRVSQKLDTIFYKGFTEEEIRQFEAFQERILANLKEEENEVLKWSKLAVL